MGCGTSSSKVSVAAPVPVRNVSTLHVAHPGAAPKGLIRGSDNQGDKYKEIKPGLQLMFLDSFQSKYSGEVMKKWRPAEVRVFDGYAKTSKVELHFVGWSSKYDRWVDLNSEEDLASLSPEALLTPEQIENGEPMDEYQQVIALAFLMTGQSPAPATQKDTAGVRTMPSTYTVGQHLDVQDVLFKDDTKWRVAEVMEVSGTKLRLHFQGWGSAPWDEVVDVAKEGHRVRPAGTMTGLQRRSMLKKSQSGLRRRTFDPNLPQVSQQRSVDSAPAVSASTRTVIYAATAATDGVASAVPDDDEASEGDNHMPEQNKITLRGTSPKDLLQNRKASPSPLLRTPAPSFPSFSADALHSRGIVPLSRTHRRHSSSGLEAGHAFNSRKVSLEASFADRMEARGLHIVEIEPDGNCLFRAVAHQLFLDPERHAELRSACVAHMSQHRQRFEVFCTTNFQHHLHRMAIDGTWAAELEVRALEEIADRVFSIYSSDSPDSQPVPMNTNFDERQLLGAAVETVNLSFHGNHYNSVFDQRHALPLPPRPSRVIQASREKAVH